jgi:hypothetical protein
MTFSVLHIFSIFGIRFYKNILVLIMICIHKIIYVNFQYEKLI